MRRNPAIDFSDLTKTRKGYDIRQLESLDFDLEFKRFKAGGKYWRDPPRIVLSEPIEIPYKSGKIAVVQDLPFLTRTAKMNCPSFSLPAGPGPTGTCLMANQADGPRTKGVAPREGKWICYACYATKGSYIYGSIVVAQAARKIWVKRALKAGSGLFAKSMIQSIEVCAAHKSLDEGTNHRLDYSYFRIHDAGDFMWAGNQYMKEWIMIAEALPRIHFWAPTRDYHSKLITGLVRPSNFTLRPSALKFGEPPPYAPGLDAGSTSSVKGHLFLSVKQDGDHDSPVDWTCPTYIEKLDKRNCDHVKCRVCWHKTDWTVDYHGH